MDPKLFLRLAPQRKMTMTFALRQALEVLQMTQLELSEWLHGEIEKNPLFELRATAGRKEFVDLIPAQPTLHEHLLTQIRDHFASSEERALAEWFLQRLDEKGFLTVNNEALTQTAAKVLSVLQTFDPPGIFARNLPESLLLQLKAKEKEDSLAFRLCSECFEDLLQCRYKAIEKKLGVSSLSNAIRDLSSLVFRPADVFKQEVAATIRPDMAIEKVEGGWTLELVEEDLPKFHLRSEYLDLEVDTPDEKEALRDFKVKAKWVCRSLDRRRRLLKQIGRFLVKKQARFLSQKGGLMPLTVRELAEELSIHESTLSRALHGKYVSTPRGTIALRSLIASSPAKQSAAEILGKLVRSEDKKNPLTDDQLAKELKAKGFTVARRTVAKYRTQLKIGSAAQRRHT